MQDPGAATAAGKSSRFAAGWIALALVLLAVVWRMPYAATKPITQVDEVRYTLPTVHRFLAGDPVFYIAGTNYGAPLEQALAAAGFRVAGESAAAFRFPTVLLGGLAAAMFFLALRATAGTWPALAIALLVAAGNSAVARYTTFSHGSYGILFVTIAAIQLATLWTDRKRTAFRWLVLGICMGVGMYALKLALFQNVASLAWLGMRSAYFDRLRQRLTDPRLRRRFVTGLLGLALGALVAAPVVYRWLTRRETFAIAPLEKWLLVAASFFFAAGATIALSTLPAPHFREWAPALCSVAVLIAIPIPAEAWFHRSELPRLTAQGIEPYSEARYSWKHLHEWPNQARLVVEGLFPALLIGRWNEVRGFEERATLGWKSAVAAAALVALGIAALRSGRRSAWRSIATSADFIFIAPFLLTLVVLFPSWSLHSESSFRYLLPFLPGFYLLAYRCVEDRVARHPRIVAALLTLYLGYCAVDCFRHIA